jgi:hypothetical protein
VVVNDLNFVSVSVPPYEADAPLIIDSNAVLALAIAAQAFEPVSSRSGQVAELPREMHLVKLPPGDSLNGPELPYRFSMKEPFSV